MCESGPAQAGLFIQYTNCLTGRGFLPSRSVPGARAPAYDIPEYNNGVWPGGFGWAGERAPGSVCTALPACCRSLDGEEWHRACADSDVRRVCVSVCECVCEREWCVVREGIVSRTGERACGRRGSGRRRLTCWARARDSRCDVGGWYLPDRFYGVYDSNAATLRGSRGNQLATRMCL